MSHYYHAMSHYYQTLSLSGDQRGCHSEERRICPIPGDTPAMG
jgi:hypothetical protein